MRTRTWTIAGVLLLVGGGIAYCGRDIARPRADGYAADGAPARIVPRPLPAQRVIPRAVVRATPSAPGTDGAVDACYREHANAVEARMRQLASSADPRDVAVQAVSRVDQPVDARTQKVLSDAAEASGDPWLAWAAWTVCHAPACDPRQALALRLRLEPDNAAVWLQAVHEELQRGDLVQADRLLQRAANAPRLDSHWGRTGRMFVERIGPLPAGPACRAAADALAREWSLERPATMDDLTTMQALVVASLTLPALTPMLNLCHPNGRIAPHRRPTCLALYTRMADQPESLYQLVGARALTRHAPTPVERAQWRERLRRLEWVQRNGVPLLSPAHLPLMWEQGEVPVAQALLEEQGRWPPPRDWQPRESGKRNP